MGSNGGETGIRTLGRLAPTTVFETAPFDHSGTSPRWARVTLLRSGVQGKMPIASLALALGQRRLSFVR